MIEYKREILPNGLTVLVHRDGSTPMAAVNLIYKVGAKDEDPERTGFAHLFEHLMFGGTHQVPQFDIPIQMAAGENNAFTNNDYTDYYIVLPKDNIETALFMESDRMRGLDINKDTLELQQKVVIEEFNQRYRNKPYGDLWLMLRPLVYKKHPYRWATIGKNIEHIENATLEEVQSFYDKFYQPGNCVLSIAADMEEQQMIDLAKKWFGDIPSGEPFEREKIIEPVQEEARRMVVRRDVPASLIYIVFHMGERTSPDFYVCDTISDLLSGGTSSRMYQNLVKRDKLFSSVNGYVMGDLEPGLFVVTGQLLAGTSVEQAEAALWSQLDELKEIGSVGEYELQKVKNKFEVNTVFGEINVMNKAMNLCYYEMVGDPALINREVEIYKSTTAENIAEVATRLFTKENSTTMLYLKNDEDYE